MSSCTRYGVITLPTRTGNWIKLISKCLWTPRCTCACYRNELVCCHLLLGVVALLPSNVFSISSFFAGWLTGRSRSQALQRPDTQRPVRTASEQTIINHLYSLHHPCTWFEVLRLQLDVDVKASQCACVIMSTNQRRFAWLYHSRLPVKRWVAAWCQKNCIRMQFRDKHSKIFRWSTLPWLWVTRTLAHTRDLQLQPNILTVTIFCIFFIELTHLTAD